jgi:CHAT domain-containing protein
LNFIREVKGLRVGALIQSSAVPEMVLEGLPKYPWVHFTCHGEIEHEDPLHSHFDLGDRKLFVKDLINTALPNVELAYLSACHSAAGGLLLLDENLHLAGAFQLAGFRSVVGTMWEMFDPDGPLVAQDFYAELMRANGGYTDAARALHYAITQSRKRGAGPERWSMFIHIGA